MKNIKKENILNGKNVKNRTVARKEYKGRKTRKIAKRYNKFKTTEKNLYNTKNRRKN